jgi:L-amino acid N-acyltransferase YncA
LNTRRAEPRDAEAIARIWNEGIEDRVATFETEPQSPAAVEKWFDEGRPVIVVEDGAELVAWATVSPYSSGRRFYEGVREFSVYVARAARGRGAGRLAVEAVAAECRRCGWYKLIGLIFPENAASRALCEALGFREVGTHVRHGRLDGEWRDVVVFELLLGDAADGA